MRALVVLYGEAKFSLLIKDMANRAYKELKALYYKHFINPNLLKF